jgi:hypothetical protein
MRQDRRLVNAETLIDVETKTSHDAFLEDKSFSMTGILFELEEIVNMLQFFRHFC